MVQSGPKWSKVVQMIQSGPNGPKWSKWSKVVQSDPNGPRWSKVVQMIQSGPRWSKVVQNYDMDFLSRNFRRVIFSGTPCMSHFWRASNFMLDEFRVTHFKIIGFHFDNLKRFEGVSLGHRPMDK